MSNREYADFDDLRPHDVVSINIKGRLLFFFSSEGLLKFRDFRTGKEAFNYYFFGWDNERIKLFLKEKAEKSNLVSYVFDDVDGILDVSFRK